MPYNNLTSRTDVAALIPEEVTREIWQDAVKQSAALSLFRQTRMARGQTRMPVLSALPTAYFVNGDTGLKQTTEANWANVYLNAEEIAAIVPIPDAVLADADYDIWAEIRPLLAEAVGRALDAAVFFGVNKPASWPTDIVAGAVAAGNTYVRGTNNAAAGGIAQDINLTMATVETDGYAPDGFVTRRGLRSLFRGARATDGQRLLDFTAGAVEGESDSIYGLPVRYAMDGLWPTAASTADLITGDFDQGVIGIRQDMTWAMSRDAVIQDNSGVIQYNAFQQDMTLMRVVFRVGFAVPNPINYSQPTQASRYPFGVLLKPA